MAASGFRRQVRTAALLGIALSALLSGCAKKHLYPGDRRPDDQVAYIEAERFLLAEMDFAIDSKPVGSLAQYYVPPGLADSWFLGKPTVGASVLPGNHTVSVRATRFGLVTAGDSACAALSFQADAGQRYKLFIVSGALVLRLLATGQPVAQTAFAACLPQRAALRD